MRTLGITQSVCPACRKIIPAKIVTDEKDVYFHKVCPEHGGSQNFVRSDVKDYLQSLRYVKPAWIPQEYAGVSSVSCPMGCGFCDRHEQHLCLPIIEITSRCNLTCPICLIDAGNKRYIPFTQFQHILDSLIRAERQIDIMNISGGEPLLHPEILAFVDEALSHPEIIRISISTNGLALLQDHTLLSQLQERNVVISLQFDGYDDKAYEILRGRPLLESKITVLNLLAESGISTSLTMTVAGGVNDDQFPQMLDSLFEQPHIVSLMIQPISFSGRGAELKNKARRLTIPDIMKLLEQAGSPKVRATDFAPLPCSHPLCFNLAYYLMLDNGGPVSLNRLVDASRMMDSLANRTIFGLDPEEQEKIKDMIYELWSGPAGCSPDTEMVMQTLRNILEEMTCSCFDPRQAFTITERRVKSIFIHAFQDADTFDLARVRRCCNAYPQPDGTMIPACVHNNLGGRT